MKMKNIFNTAFLKLWLVLFALVPTTLWAQWYVAEPGDHLQTIENDIFWYHLCVDNGIGYRGFGYVENGPVYLYTTKEESPYFNTSTTNTVIINGAEGEGEGTYYTYEVTSNDAIGIRLNGDREYLIRIHYRNDGSAPVLIKNDKAPTSIDNSVNYDQETTTVKKASLADSKTNIMTYYIPKNSGGIYWIKSAGATCYLGGFEVLPIKDANGLSQTCSNAWYIENSAESINNNNWSSPITTLNIATSDEANHIILSGATMAINDYKYNGHQTVMLTNGNRIGIKLPAGHFLKFTIVANPNTGINIYEDGDFNTPKYSKISGTGGFVDVSYPAETSNSSDQLIWIKGTSLNYVYFSGFTLEADPNAPVTPTTELVTIHDYNMYKVGIDVPVNGDILSYDDMKNHTKYVGNGTEVKWNEMVVLGQRNNAVVLQKDEDYLGFRIGSGPNGAKTGHIKIYFNGEGTDKHEKFDMPIDNDYDLGAGFNSSYSGETHTITFNAGGGRGWWFGEDSPRDLSRFNKINIEVETVSETPNLVLKVQSVGGVYMEFSIDKYGRLIGDLPTIPTTVTYYDSETKTNKEGTFDPTKIVQIYIQDTNNAKSEVKIKSARMFYKPIVLQYGTDENDPYDKDKNYEVFGGVINDVQGMHVYDYPFNIGNVDRLYWVTGNVNVAAIEVIYDNEQHAKVVDWYVNKDTKMIVGSDDPNWVWTDFNGNPVEYPKGYDEYVTFYVSAGRQAKVSFIMPEAVADVYDWEKALGRLKTSDAYVSETEALKKAYGGHVIKTKGIDGSSNKPNPESLNYQIFDRNLGINGKMDKIDSKKPLYSWYGREYAYPPSNKNEDYWQGVEVIASQVKKGDKAEAKGTYSKDSKGKDVFTINEEDTDDAIDGIIDNVENPNGGTDLNGQWKIYMRFVCYKAPKISKSSDIKNEDENEDEKVGEKLSITGAGRGGAIYYTTDSSDPDNLAAPGAIASHSATSSYSSGTFDVKRNCIVKAAQYFETPYEFYKDATLRTAVTDTFKLVSMDHSVDFEVANVVRVMNTTKTDSDLFNFQEGGYMLTLPTGETVISTKTVKDNSENDWTCNDKDFSSTPLLYLTLGGKDHPFLKDSSFELCGTNWKASNDGGLKTYLDSYQNKFDVDGVQNIVPWPLVNDKGDKLTQNQNPTTECNGFVGGPDTEEGGMFLQPISGTMLRFEPEYDGVITVWLRQNGCLDNGTQESGIFTRRPVYIMDENGRIMTRSTIKPTAEHYLGINGTYAINSSMCEERNQVEHTWLYAVAKQVFENHPVYAKRFKDLPNRWTERDDNGEFKYMSNDNSRGGAIMYGWWYKGFNIDATIEDITSASHVSRYEYMEPNLLYRSENVYKMEMEGLGLKNNFAKYGYELPNFQYVRYRIPVKAGKTYYIAGRGTKNGFSAIRFDRIKANTNINANEFKKLRFSDNPAIEENTEVDKKSYDYLKIKEDWSKIGDAESLPSDADVASSYSENTDVWISETSTTNSGTIESIVKDGKDMTREKDDKDETGVGNLEGKTCNVNLARTFTRGHWHPIILPFSISETRLEQYFGEGTKVMYLDPYEHTVKNSLDESTGKSWISAYNPALENSTLYFTLHRYQMIYANTPAFICPTFRWSADYIKKKGPALKAVNPNYKTIEKNGSVSSITFKRVTIDGSNSRNDKGDGIFGYAINEEYEVVGSYNKETLEDGEIYCINYNDTENASELKHVLKGTKVTMPATRVWIQPITKAKNNAPILKVGAKTFSELDFDYDTDQAGISDIVSDDITVETYRDDSGVYDLLGRKMGEGSLDGLPAGVYIFKGQKVYVK